MSCVPNAVKPGARLRTTSTLWSRVARAAQRDGAWPLGKEAERPWLGCFAPRRRMLEIDGVCLILGPGTALHRKDDGALWKSATELTALVLSHRLRQPTPQAPRAISTPPHRSKIDTYHR